MITELDDFFGHQIVEPIAHVSTNDRSWADRAYQSVSDPDRFGIDIGVSMYPNRGLFHTYAIAAVPGRQWSLRGTRDFSEGRWRLGAGPIEAEIIEPQKRWAFRCPPNDGGIEFDLEFNARHDPMQVNQPPIRHNGRLIHHDVYVYQTGFYSGTVTLDDQTFDVDRVPGVRDRTWGVRVAGEGQLPKGLLLWLNANFDDVSLVVQVREYADGSPQLLDGAICYDGGDMVRLVAWEHDLNFDHETRQFQGGTITVTDANGDVWPIEIEPKMYIYLSGAGYQKGDMRRDRFKEPLWHERWDLNDADVVARVEGLNDNISHMRCNGREGHGVLETSIGEHARYKVREPVVWA